MGNEISEQAQPVEPCRPFWGHLKSEERSLADGKIYFEYTGIDPEQMDDAVNSHENIHFEWPGNDYFDEFPGIGLRALRMLKRRDLTEVISLAKKIQKIIDSEIDAYIKNEMNSLEKDLSENGGDPGRYFPTGSQHTVEGWSTELPERDALSDLDALSNFLESGEERGKQFIQLGCYQAEAHELYAVLALMTICEASHSNPSPLSIKGTFCIEELIRKQTIENAKATIHAVKIMAYAEKVELEAQINKALAGEIPKLLAKAVEKRISDRATKAAQKKWTKNDHAMNFVIAEWERNHTAYEGNKTAFSRDYVRRVFNEFQVQITEKTMREFWLKGHP